jgi:hypothetical protein
MAVAVPPGARTVVLEYVSDELALGTTISLLTGLGVLVLAASSAVLARRRRPAAAPVPAPA